MSDQDDRSDDFFLDHVEAPTYHGEIDAATHAAFVRNPTCGDSVNLSLEIEGDAVRRAAFTHCGCAVSRAAASILCEHLTGRTASEARQLTPEAMLRLLRVPISPGRRQCALLAYQALRQALAGESELGTSIVDS